MRITKSELITTIKTLIESGYVRKIGDKGYDPEIKNSIQDYYSHVAEREVTKTEVSRWFKRFEELKGIRIKSNADVITIVDENSDMINLENTNRTTIEHEDYEPGLPEDVPETLEIEKLSNQETQSSENTEIEEEEDEEEFPEDFPQSNLL